MRNLDRPVPILLMVYRLHVGGTERDLAKLARYLDPNRFQVHVACFHEDGERRQELVEAGIPILPLAVRSFINRTAIVGARQLSRYVRQHGIRLIQAFDDPTSIFSTPLARLMGIKAVSSHLFFRHLIAPPNYHLLRIPDLLSHRIVVNAHAIGRHLTKDYHISPSRIFVSYNGVETSVFYPRSDPREPSLAGASLVIGSLCVFRREKRLEVLLRAFAAVHGNHPTIRLLLVGDGPMLSEWTRLREELGLQSSCQIVRTTGEVPRWMRQMDIFVLPSESEGFPNAVLEAMACGCAPVASRVGGLPELIEDGVSGLLFEPGNSDDLAVKLDTLARDPELVRRIGKAAALRACGEFSMEKAARRMEGFYDSLLS